MRLPFIICYVFVKIATLCLRCNAQYDLDYLDQRNPYEYKTKTNGGLAARPMELSKFSLPFLSRPRYMLRQLPSLAKPLKPIGGPCSCKATIASPAIVPKPSGNGYGYGQKPDFATKLLQKLNTFFGYPNRSPSPPAFVLPPQSPSYENPPPAIEAPPAPSYGLPPPSISLHPSVDGASAPALVLPPSGRNTAKLFDLPPPERNPYTLTPSGRGVQQPQYYLTPSGRSPGILPNPYAQGVSGIPNGAPGVPNGALWPLPGFVYPQGNSYLAPSQQLSPSALNLPQNVPSGTQYGLQGTYNPPGSTSGGSDPVPVPSDPVSMQLALNAREQALKKVVDDELSFGFKTLPKDGTLTKPLRDVPEEKLQQMKGVVVALQPAGYVEIPKSIDDEAAASFLPEKMISKSRTQLVVPSKKPTLGEMGYAPAIIHPPPVSSVPLPSPQQTTFDVPGAPSSTGPCNDHIPGQVMSGTAPKSETYVHPAPQPAPCNSGEEQDAQGQGQVQGQIQGQGQDYPTYGSYSK